jgi:hypothetical protein
VDALEPSIPGTCLSLEQYAVKLGLTLVAVIHASSRGVGRSS